jgi:hypothetical protein
MMAANRNSSSVGILTLAGVDIERGLRAGIASPGRSAAAIIGSLGDPKWGNTAYLRIRKIALPAMLDERARKFHADDANGRQWWHPAFLEAIGNYPIVAGEHPSNDRFLAYAAEVVAKATRPPAIILHFPIMRRLEQVLDDRDDHNSFPEGPDAA